MDHNLWLVLLRTKKNEFSRNHTTFNFDSNSLLLKPAAHRCLPVPASFNTTDDAGARQSGEEFTEIPDETSKKPDSQVGSSFSKLMAEVGGAWRIFIFMSFTASLFAFIYMVILRYLGGVIIWVSKEC